jgi:hypothetical protein
MSKRVLVMALALVLTLAGGWALAQIGGGPLVGPAAHGRIIVSASDKTSVLVNTATGTTWLLEHSGDRAVWVPARRLDTEAEVAAWREKEKNKKPEQEPQGK